MTNGDRIRQDEHYADYTDDEIASTFLDAAQGDCEICACSPSCQNGEPEYRCCYGTMRCWLEEEVDDD